MAIPNGDIRVGETKVNSQVTTQSDLEIQLERVLSAMEGVGEVEVMITLESTGSSLFGESNNNQKVCGVVIVAEGAGNSIVEARISNAVKALFSIEAHKISIVKRAMQEEDK
jgi:stage III sporulation protein AG